VKSTTDSLNGGFGSWSVSLTKSCDVLCKELEATGAAGFAAVGFLNGLTYKTHHKYFIGRQRIESNGHPLGNHHTGVLRICGVRA
jgi:hypothetical protein